jgi:hypothetical protein
MNGYVSTFFEQKKDDKKIGKTAKTLDKLVSLEETSEVQSEEEKEGPENDENFSIEYTGENSVSPPIRLSPTRSSTKSSEIPNVKPSPPILSKKNSKAVFTIEKGKTFDLNKESKKSLNSKLTSNEEFDDFFGNISDVVFCYNENPKDKKEEEEKVDVKTEEKVVEKDVKKDKILTNQDTFKYKIKNKTKLNSSLKGTELEMTKLKTQKFYRKKLPNILVGKNEIEIRKLINIPDIIFVNNQANIACGFTLRSVIALAEYSLYN